MSPEERASAIIAHFPNWPPELTPELSRVSASAIRKAVRAELKKSLRVVSLNLRAAPDTTDLLYGKSLAWIARLKSVPINSKISSVQPPS